MNYVWDRNNIRIIDNTDKVEIDVLSKEEDGEKVCTTTITVTNYIDITPDSGWNPIPPSPEVIQPIIDAINGIISINPELGIQPIDPDLIDPDFGKNPIDPELVDTIKDSLQQIIDNQPEAGWNPDEINDINNIIDTYPDFGWKPIPPSPKSGSIRSGLMG